MLLTDILIQCARTHTGGERRFLFHPFLHGMVEEIRHKMIIKEKGLCNTALGRDK
jgi:hypothetical protein